MTPAETKVMRGTGGLALSALLLGCQWGVRTDFHRTDPGPWPVTGSAPPVYLYAADVPNLDWRSVGLIDSTVPAKCGIHGAMNAAAAKGREVGCHALVEHGAFVRVKSRRGKQFGALNAAVTLVQASGQRRIVVPPPPPSSGDSITIRFDCAVPAGRDITVVALP